MVNPLTSDIIITLVTAIIYVVIGEIVIQTLLKILKTLLNDKDIKKILNTLGSNEGIEKLVINAINYYLHFILILIVLLTLGASPILIQIIIAIMIIALLGVMLLLLKNFIPNAAAAIYLTTSHTLEKGDKVKIGSHEGEVLEINLQSTILKVKKDELIIIPNQAVTKQAITKKKWK